MFDPYFERVWWVCHAIGAILGPFIPLEGKVTVNHYKVVVAGGLLLRKLFLSTEGFGFESQYSQWPY